MIAAVLTLLAVPATEAIFREQIHLIKRNESLPADFNVSFGPTGDVWNPRTGELIGSIVHGP